eukprot:403367842
MCNQDNIEVKINKVLGEGANGTVYQVNLFEKLVQKELAMKVIRRQDKQSLNVSQQDLNEFEVLMDIENPYVNKIIHFYTQFDQETKKKELVILQPQAIMSLDQFIEKNYKSESMPENQAIEFIAQIAIGLKSLHDKTINHRGLNSKNVLVFENKNRTPLNDSEYILKISDHGCTKIIENNMDINTKKNQTNYSFQTYSPYVDIIELFFTAYSMLNIKFEDFLDRKCKDTYSYKFLDFLHQMYSKGLKRKLTIEEIIENPIIQKSQTYINCLLNGILPIPTQLMEKGMMMIDIFQQIQETMKKQEQKLTDDLFEDYSEEKLMKRLKKPLLHSVPEIGRILFKMKQIKSKFTSQDQRQVQLEKAFCSNYMQELMKEYNGPIDEDKILKNSLELKRRVDINGSIFVGYYKENQKYYGRLYEQESIKEGYFANNVLDGEGCQFDIHDDTENYYFEGKFVKGKRQGQGTMLMSSRAMYCGEFLNDQRQGEGTYYHKNGNKFTGQFEENKENGKGLLEFEKGGNEEGNWKNGLKHGIITRVYKNGEKLKIYYDKGKEISREKNGQLKIKTV